MSRPPKKRRRYSASPDKNSGRSTVTSAPAKGPSTVPEPPMRIANKNRIDCENGKLLGAMNIISGVNRPPARPAVAAAMTKAADLTTNGR